jgi:hypothetical protein
VAECVHEDTHLGGMALAHARHVGGGADGAAGDQDALLSVCVCVCVLGHNILG